MIRSDALLFWEIPIKIILYLDWVWFCKIMFGPNLSLAIL